MTGFVKADTAGFGRLADDFRKSIVTANIAAMAGVRGVGQVILRDAKQRASYSKRIPAAGRIRYTAHGVVVEFVGASAPNAAPIENRGRGFVKHPTFGHGPLTAKHSHPAFLAPSLAAHRTAVNVAVGGGVVAAVRHTLHSRS